MTENVEKTDLSGYDVQTDVARRLFRHTEESSLRSRLQHLPVKRLGILAMCLFVGFLWACKPANEVAESPSIQKKEDISQEKSEPPSVEIVEKPQVKSEPPSVENVVFVPKQMENGPVPTDIRITMTKEVNAVQVDGYAAIGAGKNWSIKLEKLKLEKKISSIFTLGTNMASGPIGLFIGWRNKDGTVMNRLITVLVKVEKTIKNDGTSDEPRLVHISLRSL